MQLRALPLLISAAALAVLSGCSGGGSASGLNAPGCGTADAQAFCVVACNLGCGETGCTITEIAQNQPITFEFNRLVDPKSVNFSTIQIKTADGTEPVGQFLVQGNKVTFAPEIRVVGNSSFFGFKNGASYTLLMREGAVGVPAVQSLSGDRLSRRTLCALHVSRGIVDLDQQPPRATLVTPTTTTNVVRDTQIVLRFSEIVDAGPFQTTVARDLPVLFRVRSTRPGANGPECDPGAEAVALTGALRLQQDLATQSSSVTFTPIGKLPSEGCVEIEVTTRLRDVAGTPSRGQLFRFVVEQAPLEPTDVVEDFLAPVQLDADRSAGEWGGGRVVPAALGGDGLHGEFTLELAVRTGQDEYLLDLDRDVRGNERGVVVPGSSTLTGRDEFVADGVFRFSTFHLPANARLTVRGSKPLRMLVRGKCDIQGTLDLRGANVPDSFNAKISTPPFDRDGQPGGSAGAGGGNGGDGGSLRANMGNGRNALYDGKDGQAVQVDATHAYASEVAVTAGRGADQWPDDGLNSSITHTYFNTICQQSPAPGGGGGFVVGGGEGQNNSTVGTPGERAPNTPASGSFSVLRDPMGRPSSIHYMVGGAGGGGGGTHSFYALTTDQFKWRAGGGGGGGGGALGIRVGRELVMAPGSLIDVSGGRGAGGGSVATGPATCGGGGSAGSVLLQSSADYSLQGVMRALGGAGGSVVVVFAGFMKMDAGAGSAGYVRVEAPTRPPVNRIGTVEPAPTADNTGTLSETDVNAGVQSLWYVLDESFPPRWRYYELEAVVDGIPIVYSDDPTRGSGRAAIAFQEPVGLIVQGTKVEDGRVQPPTTPWRSYIGPFDTRGEGNIGQDAATAFRFQIIFQRPTPNSTLEVRKLTIRYES